jgi:hypothetical protein
MAANKRKLVKKTRGNRVGDGTPGPGRPKGKPNKVTAEIRELAQNLFDDAFWEMMYKDIHNRTAHPALVKELLYYGYGKPKERVEHGLDDDAKDLLRAPPVERIMGELARIRKRIPTEENSESSD